MSLAYPLLKKKLYTEELYQSEDGLTSFKNYLLHTGKGILSILFCSVLFSYFCVPFSLSLEKKEPAFVLYLSLLLNRHWGKQVDIQYKLY